MRRRLLALAIVLATLAGCGVSLRDSPSGDLSAGQVELAGELAAPAVDVGAMREAQRLSNSLFEIIPGEVLTSPHRDGTRYSIRFRVRSFEVQKTLQKPFWSVEVEAYDQRGQTAPGYANVLSWSGNVPPLSQLTGTMLVVADGADLFHVTVSYNEPGRNAAAIADFVWPYGR